MVDVVALKKFADVFGPAVESIPAVLDALGKQADMDRHIALKKRELDEVIREIERQKAEGEAFIKHTQDLADKVVADADARAQGKLDAMDAQLNTAMSAKQKLQDEASALTDLVVKARAELAGIEAQGAVKRAEIQAANDEYAAKLNEQIKVLEDRHAKAEKSLAALKAKLEV